MRASFLQYCLLTAFKRGLVLFDSLTGGLLRIFSPNARKNRPSHQWLRITTPHTSMYMFMYITSPFDISISQSALAFVLINMCIKAYIAGQAKRNMAKHKQSARILFLSATYNIHVHQGMNCTQPLTNSVVMGNAQNTENS